MAVLLHKRFIDCETVDTIAVETIIKRRTDMHLKKTLHVRLKMMITDLSVAIDIYF